ncbi:MAG: hypothetical protein JNK05_40015 [Myxococcales bacterium]|nr:hypothetical protein [Myxococcales bacterium]
MNQRVVYALLGASALAAAGLTAIAQTEPGSVARTTVEPLPAVVTLEGDPESSETFVRLRRFDSAQPLRELGTIRHAQHAARRGALLQRGSRSIVLVTANIRPPSGHTYESQLFAVENGATRPLTDGVSVASAPLVTARGTVLVQRGTDGPEPVHNESNRGEGMRERVDALEITAVDVDNGQTRSVFRAQGQSAWLGCALRDDEALVYHVTTEGAFLRVIDASNGAQRTILGPIPALARDFSYDRERDEITFVRAASVGSDEYEIVTMSARGGSLRVRHHAPSHHLMPRVLSDGAIAFSPAGDPGLGLIDRASNSVRVLSPLGSGSDWVAAEHSNGRWIAVRHLDQQSNLDTFVVSARDGSRRATFRDDANPVEIVGFWGGVTP